MLRKSYYKMHTLRNNPDSYKVHNVKKQLKK